MTVDTRSLAMNAITVKIVTVIIVRSVRHIVRYAIPQFVSAVAMNARLAINLFAGTALLYVPNAI